MPVAIPAGVEVKIDGSTVSVKGPKGTLSRTLSDVIDISIENNILTCSPKNEEKETKALWGLSRVLVNNMVTGVSQGFKKSLEVIGVGYRVEMKGKMLLINVGYSHPFLFEQKDGITFTVEGTNKLTVEGIDKEKVGQIASDIRAIRPPEPYKGKGIKYEGEYIARKAGKTAGK